MKQLKEMVGSSRSLEGNSLFDVEEKWYSVEDLASLCGYDVQTLKKGDSLLRNFSIDFEVESKIMNMGGNQFPPLPNKWWYSKHKQKVKRVCSR